MTIVDPLLMRNIDRYRNVNIDAKSAEAVLVDALENSAAFLYRCVSKIAEVRFLDSPSGDVYVVFKNRQLVWCQLDLLTQHSQRAFLDEFIASFTIAEKTLDASPVIDIEAVKQDTLGSWG